MFKTQFRLLGLCLISLVVVACNKSAKRYNAKTINPELIGVWQSMDGCYLNLKIESSSLILVNYHDNKSLHLAKNIQLNYKPYSIETKLTSNKSDQAFNAKYIDGTIIIESDCNSPLQKVAN